MDLTKLSKTEPLAKSEENEIKKCKSKNKEELIILLENKPVEKKKFKLIIEDEEEDIKNEVITQQDLEIQYREIETKSKMVSLVDMSFCEETLEYEFNTENNNVSCEYNTEGKLLEILKTIDWQKFHNLCSSIGKDLNDRQWRFLKSIFLETAVASYSNNQLTYVGDLEQGCDFRVTNLNNLRIEMKYVEGCIFSGNKLSQKKTTSEIKLMNSNGTNTHAKLPDTYSDYLLIVDLNGAGLLSKEILQNYIILGGDGIKAKIPLDKLHIVFQPSDITGTNKKDLRIKELFMDTISKIINSK
jgi:hypothetical protein